MVRFLFLVERPRSTLAAAAAAGPTSVAVSPATTPLAAASVAVAPGPAASAAESGGSGLFDRLALRNLALEPRDRSQVDATLTVDLRDFYLEALSHLDGVLDSFDPAFAEFGDVNKPVPIGCDVDERPERRRIYDGSEDALADLRHSWVDRVLADLVDRHGYRHDPRCVCCKALARSRQALVHLADDVQPRDLGCAEGITQHLGGNARDLGIELEGGDELLRSRNLEVHVAERVLVSEDVGKRNKLP